MGGRCTHRDEQRCLIGRRRQSAYPSVSRLPSIERPHLCRGRSEFLALSPLRRPSSQPIQRMLARVLRRSDYRLQNSWSNGNRNGSGRAQRRPMRPERRFFRRPHAARSGTALKQTGPKRSASRSPRMLSRPAVEQASVVPFVARIAVLVAAGCFLPALPATAEDDVPPTAICPNPELSLSGVISVPDGPSAGAEYVVCMPAP
jgi:hypothetical protein